MAKIKGAKIKSQSNFMGRGVMDPSVSGRTPKEFGGMGDYYGTGIKNSQGRMRGDSVGYRPVSRKQLGTPPKSVV